uniref:hypothetical protein n=1 Tax=Escherichia coli TaxID=562 RepID=UPI000B7D88E1
SADYRDYGEQGQINASFGYRAGCDAGASYLAYELHNLLMLLGFVGRIRRLLNCTPNVGHNLTSEGAVYETFI